MCSSRSSLPKIRKHQGTTASKQKYHVNIYVYIYLWLKSIFAKAQLVNGIFVLSSAPCLLTLSCTTPLDLWLRTHCSQNLPDCVAPTIPPIPPLPLKTTRHVTAKKRTPAHLSETAYNHLSFTKPPSRAKTATHRKHISDLQKTTSKQDTETTPHHFATLNTETPPNLANTSGTLKTTTLNIVFPGAFSRHTRRITAH